MQIEIRRGAITGAPTVALRQFGVSIAYRRAVADVPPRPATFPWSAERRCDGNHQ